MSWIWTYCEFIVHIYIILVQCGLYCHGNLGKFTTVRKISENQHPWVRFSETTEKCEVSFKS